MENFGASALTWRIGTAGRGLPALLILAAGILGSGPGAAQLAEAEKFLPSVGQPGSNFGVDVAVAGDLAVVGTEYSHVFVFERTEGGWQELAVLEAPAGTQTGSGFGRSVDVSGRRIVVGAPTNDPVDDGIFDRLGSFFVFEEDAEGWFLAQHVPNPDPAREDQFGFPVRIQGDTIFAGMQVPKVGDPGRPGEMFIYRHDGSEFVLGQRFNAPSPQPHDHFPNQFAVHGETLLAASDDIALDPTELRVTVHEYRDIGSSWVPTGVTLLRDPDVKVEDSYGFSIALHGDVAVIGAPGTDGKGQKTNIGAVYVHVYDGSDYGSPEILQAGDTDPSAGFGEDVALSGDVLLVGAPNYDGFADNAGSVNVFERMGDSFEQTTVLIAGDSEAGDQFGHSVAIDNGLALINARRDDDAGDNQGAVYVYDCGADTDEDGLCDEWETLGVPYFDDAGDLQRYVLDSDGDTVTDADPMHKDLFVEIDVMDQVGFPLAAQDHVKDAFFVAPLTNPDSAPGVTLHLVVEDGVFPFEELTHSTEGGFPPGASVLKETQFGTAQEKIAPSASALLRAKAKAYRYALVFNDVVITNEDDASIGGVAEFHGDDQVMYAGGFSDLDKAAVFMHELGHNLGLDHGGRDYINGKPNYVSVMNYTLAFREPWNELFWTLDYSREELAPLDEGNLDELVSVGAGGTGLYANVKMPYYSIVADEAPCYPPADWLLPRVEMASLDPSATTDFNLDCDDVDANVTADLNYLDGSDLPSTDNPSPGELLLSSNDWEHVRLRPTDGGGHFAGRRPRDELTDAGRQFMQENFMPEPAAWPGLLLGGGLVLRLARRRTTG